MDGLDNKKITHHVHKITKDLKDLQAQEGIAVLEGAILFIMDGVIDEFINNKYPIMEFVENYQTLFTSLHQAVQKLMLYKLGVIDAYDDDEEEEEEE